MGKYIISAVAASNVGKRRNNNEDNYYLNHNFVNSSNNTQATLSDTDRVVCAVCDGMGGEAAGELASQIAVQSIENFEKVLFNENFSDESINALINRANNAICDEINKKKKRIGTTVTLLGIKDNDVVCANVGDSRIYRFFNGQLEQVSHDHTEAQTLVDAGMIGKEESMKTKEKHRLTQHLGIFPYEMIIEPYIVKEEVKLGEKFLLCSDGLTDMLTEQEIAEILAMDLTVNKTVNLLISRALDNGGKDNVTVLLCEVQENEPAYVPKEALESFSMTKPSESVDISRDNLKNKSKVTLILGIAFLLIVCIIASFVIGHNFGKKSNNEINNLLENYSEEYDEVEDREESTTENQTTVTSTTKNNNTTIQTTKSSTTKQNAKKSTTTKPSTTKQNAKKSTTTKPSTTKRNTKKSTTTKPSTTKQNTTKSTTTKPSINTTTASVATTSQVVQNKETTLE